MSDLSQLSDAELYALIDEDLAEQRCEMAGDGWEAERIERHTGAEAREREFCHARQISPCCRAAYDLSQVIQVGRFQGHGAYFCSACGAYLFQV